MNLTCQKLARGGVTVKDGTAVFTTKTVCAREWVNAQLSAYSNTANTKALIDAAIDAISIKAGDTMTCTYAWNNDFGVRTAGLLTGANKMVFFTIPLNRPVKATKVTISNGTLTVRQGGYLFGDGDEVTAIPTTATVQALLTGFDSISVCVTFASSIGGTNNSPVGITFTGKLTFS